MAGQKLELTWVGKNKPVKLEPRLLLEVPEKSYCAKAKHKGDIFDNMLIHGDNLLALKALESKFAGQVKCVYIDPPYNTGAAFEHYDDNKEHSIWLNLMKARLDLLKKLLSDEGILFVQIDNNECAYLKVLCDEVFGRENFQTMITCKVKSQGGLTANDAMFFDCSEYILVYSKSATKVTFNFLKTAVEKIDSKSKTAKNYNQVLRNIDYSKMELIKEIDGMTYYRIPKGAFEIIRLPVATMTAADFYDNRNDIFRLTALSGGIGKKLKEQTADFINNDDLFVYEYIPTRGRDAGKRSRYFLYKGNKVSYLNNYVSVDDENKTLTKLEGASNIIFEDLWQGIASEGGVKLNNGKKPEKLLEMIISIATNPGDLVLDSFLGSGTTAAVAHKMNRRWIGIELGDHCETHAMSRLKNVVDGTDQSGISKSTGWQGGGGFRFYELAPSLIKKDEYGIDVIDRNHFDAAKLAEAVCKIMGFEYTPSQDEYFIHGQSTENAFIYVTTNFMTAEHIRSISQKLGNRHLSILCKAFDAVPADCENITISKIPKEILDKCEWGHDDYSLNVKNLPMSEIESEPSLNL